MFILWLFWFFYGAGTYFLMLLKWTAA